MVATGLGQQATQADSPVRVVQQPTASAELNYQDLDQPTVQRQRAVGDGLSDEADTQEELLGIPAFLRRQAD